MTRGERIIDFSKQAQALISAALPFLDVKLSLLPFLNPQIPADMSRISGLLVFVCGCLVFNVARRWMYPKTTIVLGSFGVLLAFGSIFVILLIFDGIVFSHSPSMQDLAIRAAYVGLFGGVSMPIGWTAAIIFS
jgi:hypothetical protein